MKKKYSPTARFAVMALSMVAVVFAVGSLSKQDSQNLKVALGQYSYNSKPIDYNASNFACNPGPIQPADAGKYADSYNTYWHGYSEAYANNGIKGSWCQNYLPSIQQDPTLYDDPPLKTSTTTDLTDHTKGYTNAAVYKVTDANGNEDKTNNLYRRWQYHIDAAKKHENIVMIYENSLPGYGTYYMTGEAYGGDKDSYTNLYANSVVHCPDFAQAVDHTKYGSATSSAHLYNQNSTQGMYDGQGHKWCELNGVAVNPIMGPESGKAIPDLGGGYAMLYKFTFSDGTPDGIDYYKYYKNGSYLSNVGSPESDWVKCSNGVAGPFIDGVNSHSVSQYESETNKNKAKIPHYHCLGSGGYKFAEPVKDDVGPPAPYNTYSFKSIKYSETTAAAGDSANGGADTMGAISKNCSRGTYWCQTTDAKNRYCSSTPDCTGKFTPPAPSWTIGAPKNLKLNSTKTTFTPTENIEFKGEFAVTGTEVTYGINTTTVEVSKNSDFSTIDFTTSATQTVYSNGTYVSAGMYITTPGTYYYRMKNSLGNQVSPWTISGSTFTVSSGSTGTSTTTSTSTSTNTDSSLLGYWKFDGNGNNEVAGSPEAKIVGSASFKADGGKIGGYAYIPATSDYVKIPYNQIFDLPETFSVEFWFRQRSDQSFFQDLVYKGTSLNNYNFRIFRQLWNQYNSGPIITGYTALNTGYWTQTSNPNQLAHNVWHHVVFVKSTSNSSYYLDGVEIHNSGASVTAKTPQKDIIIGDSAVDTDIDNLKIYNRALTAADIAASGPFPVVAQTTTATTTTGTTTSTTSTTTTSVNPIYWKEMIWNDLGLKSNIATNAPQAIIDATKKACEKTKPEQATWSNPNDFTWPETAGIPTCPAASNSTATGTTTTSAVTGSNNGGGSIAASLKGCANGEKCNSGSWCSNGKQCYYPDGSFTCAEWGSACEQGTKRCSLFDTNCIEPDSAGKLEGYCIDGLSCYSKDKKEKFCKSWNPMAAGSGSAATGYMPAATYQQPSCPATYPKLCGSNDTNCTELYETGSASSYCAGGGKQCYKPDGNLYCVKPNEECPKEASSLCKAEDKYCTEPEKYGPKDGWCAMGSAQFYTKSGSGIYCVKIDNNDPTAWEKAVGPADTSRCRNEDKYCLDGIGKSGPSGSWCAAGMSKYNKDGSVTCVSMKDYKPEDNNWPVTPITPPPDVCIQVTTLGYKPDTMECKTFATPCNVPKGWATVTDGRMCNDGKLAQIDDANASDNGIIDHAKDRYDYLVTLVHQTREVPDYVTGIKAFREKLALARLKLKTILNYPDKTKMKEEAKEFLKSVLPEIELQWKDLIPYIEPLTMKKEIEKELEGYRVELSLVDTASEYGKKLKEGVEKLKSLLSSLDSQSEQAREAVVSSINQTRSELQKLIKSHRELTMSDSLEENIASVVRVTEEFNRFIQEKGIEDNKVTFMLERLRKIIEELKNVEGTATDRSKLLDQAIWLKGRLSDWLAGYGYKESETNKFQQTLDYVDKAVSEKINILVDKISNKMELLIDTVTQELTVRIAEVAQQFADKFSAAYENKAATVLANLAAVESEKRQKIGASTNKILGKLKDLDTVIESAKLTTFGTQSMRDTMEMLAVTTWCGENAEDIQTRINNIGLVLESGEVTPEEIDTFRSEVEALKYKNIEMCYKEGVIAFKDSTLEDWHNQYAEYNYQQGWVTGYKDESGNRLGQLGAGNPTLRVEALAMVMRLFGIAEGRTDALDKPVKGVPSWGIGYVNGAVSYGINFDWSLAMDQPITRLEAAKLFVGTMSSIQGQSFFTPATEINVADDRYNDWSSVARDSQGALAVEALTDVGIFQGGGDGGFHPYDSLLRSEFVTTNKRLAETYDLLR